MKFDPSKCEEPQYGLYDWLGHSYHAGGESRADCSTQELWVGEDAAWQDEETKDHEEGGVQGWEGGGDVGRLAQDHGDRDEDWQSVVCIDMQHLNDTFVILLRTFLDKSQVASLAITTVSKLSNFVEIVICCEFKIPL